MLMLKRPELIAIFLICGLALFAMPRAAHAAACEPDTSGLWTTPATWECDSAPAVPAPGDSVIIGYTGGFPITIDSGVMVVRTSTTTIYSSGNLENYGTLYNFGTMVINGNLYNAGTIINYGTLEIYGPVQNYATIIDCGIINGSPSDNPIEDGPCDVESLPFKVNIGCLNDGRLNSICDHAAAPAVLYCQPNGDLHVYRIDAEGEGHYSFTVTPQQIEDAGIPTDNPGATLIAASPDSAIRLYRLSDEQFQLNSPVVDQVHGYLINGYTFLWSDLCPE